MLRKSMGLAALVLLSATAVAQADPATYTWTGVGNNTQGATKCPTYKMTINVTVDGTAVKGDFQQQGRDERHFDAVLDGKGAFKTKAHLGGGAVMDVAGTITDKVQHVVLDGYCKFDGKLTKK